MGKTHKQNCLKFLLRYKWLRFTQYVHEKHLYNIYSRTVEDTKGI
jgi:hypothetical protein